MKPQTIEKIMQVVFSTTACLSVLFVLIICGFLFFHGIPTMAKIGVGNFLFKTIWKPLNQLFGIFPIIIGKIYVTIGAIIIAMPLGIMAAILLTFFCSKKWSNRLSKVVDVMASVPSVVFGFFGLVV